MARAVVNPDIVNRLDNRRIEDFRQAALLELFQRWWPEIPVIKLEPLIEAVEKAWASAKHTQARVRLERRTDPERLAELRAHYAAEAKARGIERKKNARVRLKQLRYGIIDK